MTRDPGSPLDLVARLEADDGRVARDLARANALLERADAVGARARELDESFASLPELHAGLQREETAGHDALADARAALAEAERRLAETGGSRRAEKKREQAELDLGHAREAVAEAERRVERVVARRGELGAEERRWRAEIPALVTEAQAVAGELDDVTGLSESGRIQPEEDLRGLEAWAGRVRAALLVVSSRLVAERERLVREATELGAAVLGEPVEGSSVERVRRRVEQALGR